MDEYKEKLLTDIGTRYEHYQELKSEWEAGIEILNDKILTPVRLETLLKLIFSVEILDKTLETFANYNDAETQYKLSRDIDSIGTINQLAGRE